MPFILQWECVYAKGHYGDLQFVVSENNDNDPGGLTKFGIDAANHKGVDIARLTLESATAIYWHEWIQTRSGTFPAPMGEVFFNACVNAGGPRACALLHDPATHNTASAFLAAQDRWYRELVVNRRASRAAHAGDKAWLKKHPDLSEFLKGWLNRTAALRRFLRI